MDNIIAFMQFYVFWGWMPKFTTMQSYSFCFSNESNL